MRCKEVFGFNNKFIDFIIGVEVRGLHIVLTPLQTRVSVHKFVVFFENLPKTREIEVLIVL